MKRGVLLPVLIQDPVVAGETRARNIVHPVIVKDPAGFNEGPACRRVAVVDLDFRTGKLRPPAKFDPRGSPYRDIASYYVAVPTKKGLRAMPWTRGSEEGMDVGKLGFIAVNDPFMKVSVFGTVLRTLGLVQDAAVLGREVPWAFRRDQLLVVPRAGELDNAFYHRDSHSLQFYYGSASRGSIVYSGLSQDIVAHETAHAIIDGIAPDLYDAISPESLAIHEGLADLTAALLSMRNRELFHKPGRAINTKPFQQSSRFSRIAEEFGRWRGHGDSLRDLCNNKTLDRRAADDRRVDCSSPHSMSEVLSGLLFAVFRTLFMAAPRDPAVKHKISSSFEGLRYRIAYATNRTLGLAYRGLDWLPPGDASFADFVRAMVAADHQFFPNNPQAREVLSREAGLRGITVTAMSKFMRQVEVPLNAAARRTFVERHREVLGIPPDARVIVTVRPTHIYAPPILPNTTSESFELKPNMTRWTSEKTEHFIVKLAWWRREPNDIAGWGTYRRFRTGTTIVTEKSGRVRSVLQNPHIVMSTNSRSAFLRRILKDVPRTQEIGPDGAVLQRGFRTRLANDMLSITGAMRALHVVAELG